MKQLYSKEIHEPSFAAIFSVSDYENWFILKVNFKNIHSIKLENFINEIISSTIDNLNFFQSKSHFTFV